MVVMSTRPEAKHVSWTFSSVVGTAAPMTGADAMEAGGDTDAPADAMPTGRWASDICACLNRPISCLAVFCCASCTLGQASSISVGGSATRCLTVFATIFILTFLGYILQLSSEAAGQEMMTASVVLMVVGSILAFAIVFAARRAIRTKQRIQGSDAEDCCLALFCNTCAVCQILNNLTGRYKGFWSTYAVIGQEGDDQAPVLPK